jgi:TfoX/Sxy family transcriptional regulator of competence genes
MAYDEELATRLVDCLPPDPEFTEKKMFGGLCIMYRGNMCCGIVGSELMLRVGVENYADSLARPHAREMDFTGRALNGFIYVGEEGLRDDTMLRSWIERALAFVGSLPPK